MSDRYDDDSIDKPLEGAEEASVAEGEGRSPAIGRDEWVARHGERRASRGRIAGAVEQQFSKLPWWASWGLFTLAVALVPLVVENSFWRRVGFDILLYMLLALGLNVVVGWGGLLDLGYIAFYGLGAYFYAMLASSKFDIHMWAVLAIPLVIVAVVVIGFLVGLPSWRLSGDYLAIVTLFFYQIFLTVITNGDNIGGLDVTGGANGIPNVDPIDIFGWDIVVAREGAFNVAYYYIALGFFVIVLVALRFVNLSRIGRSWRALREDELAAEVMSMPTNWLKLVAFATGAGVAALTGTLFASLNGGVFHGNFGFPLLIIIYVMVIFGGAGSQAGVVLGAISIGLLLELLRADTPGEDWWVVYPAIAIGVVALLRPWWRAAAILAGTIAFGLVITAVVGEIWPGTDSAVTDRGLDLLMLRPENVSGGVAAVSYIGFVAAALSLTVIQRRLVRDVLLVPALWLGAFVWENVMVEKPEPTRFIILGVILVVTMIVRPQGVLGERRVEIV